MLNGYAIPAIFLKNMARGGYHQNAVANGMLANGVESVMLSVGLMEGRDNNG